MARNPIILCELLSETRKEIASFAEALKKAAPGIGSHGLSEQEFWDAEIFRASIKKLRGTQAAYTAKKRGFMASVLNYMKSKGHIQKWEFTGTGERHDYIIEMPGKTITAIETKGCLDGNNTNIFESPPQADEFIIWSLCQNPGSDPRHNAWSGIHTRLSAEVIHRQQRVDGVIIWDMLCGTAGRPCPKLVADPDRITIVDGRRLPPPCIYLFPRTIPDPRNNPTPRFWKIDELKLIQALLEAFKGAQSDAVEVLIEARMSGADVERRTRFFRRGEEFSSSSWTKVSRARR